MDNIELKPIIGYKGRYAISKNGMVYSYLTNKFLKPVMDPEKGEVVTLCSDVNDFTNTMPRYKNYYIHRLVAETYIVERELKTEEKVYHVNGDKFDNYYMNLRIGR